MGIPYLKYIPPFSFIYTSIKKHMDTFKTYIQNLLSEQKQTFDEQNLRQGSVVIKAPCCTIHVLPRGYVDHFLAEVARTQEGHYTDQQLIVTLIDFFTGEALSSFLSTLLSLTYYRGKWNHVKDSCFRFFLLPEVSRHTPQGPGGNRPCDRWRIWSYDV